MAPAPKEFILPQITSPDPLTDELKLLVDLFTLDSSVKIIPVGDLALYTLENYMRGAVTREDYIEYGKRRDIKAKSDYNKLTVSGSLTDLDEEDLEEILSNNRNSIPLGMVRYLEGLAVRFL